MEWSGLSSVLGVELRLLAGEQYSCRCCVLVSKNQHIDMESTMVIEGNIIEVINAIPKSMPMAMVITGKGIIHKSASLEGKEEGQLFQTVFAGVNPSDFYVQQMLGGENVMLSIIRKQVVDHLLEKLGTAGAKIFMLGLGGIGMMNLLPQLGVSGDQFVLDGHRLMLDNNVQLKAYQFEEGLKSEIEVKLGERKITAEQLVAYAAAFQFLLHDRLELINAGVPQVDERFASYLENSEFKKKGMIVMAVMFVLLLINFFVFSYYNGENERLSMTSSAQRSDADQLATIQMNIAKHELLLKELNWNSGYNYGFLVHEIGKGCPRSAKLNTLSFNEDLKEKQEAAKIPNIKIIGVTSNLAAVNNWIFELKEKNWVKAVRLMKYKQTETSGEYEFNLLISY